MPISIGRKQLDRSGLDAKNAQPNNSLSSKFNEIRYERRWKKQVIRNAVVAYCNSKTRDTWEFGDDLLLMHSRLLEETRRFSSTKIAIALEGSSSKKTSNVIISEWFDQPANIRKFVKEWRSQLENPVRSLRIGELLEGIRDLENEINALTVVTDGVNTRRAKNNLVKSLMELRQQRIDIYVVTLNDNENSEESEELPLVSQDAGIYILDVPSRMSKYFTEIVAGCLLLSYGGEYAVNRYIDELSTQHSDVSEAVTEYFKVEFFKREDVL